MDSRHYRFVFPVNTICDIPSDFLVSDQTQSFDRGLFIPQDDKRWFTEKPAYPARLLLLQDKQLSVITHPSAGENDVRLLLKRVPEFETGRSLLSGWIRFKTQDHSFPIFYNTRASEAVDFFVAAVRERWLESYSIVSQPEDWQPRSFGCKPDLKFRNMLSDALDVYESVWLQYFVEPRACPRRVRGFQRSHWYPGHLLAITSRSRVLWLTDEYHGQWSRYAGSAISAPLYLFRNAEVSGQSALVLQFASALSWRICLYTIEPDANAFLGALQLLSQSNR